MSLFNNQPNQEPQQEERYGTFSYNSYEQVQAWRRRRRRSVWVVASLASVFCALTLISNLMLLRMYEGSLSPDEQVGPSQVGNPGTPAPAPQPTPAPADPAPTPAPGGSYTMDIQDQPGPDSESGVTVVDVSAVVERASASVVGILSESYGGGYYGAVSTGTGTGIILSEDGYIVTNHHVVEGGTLLTVIVSDEESYEAKLVGSDAQMDLAVLKIEAEGLTPAQFGDSDAIKVGQAAIAIGNPGGMDLSGTTTYGIISGINRSVEIGNYRMNLLQTDASINPGNSGGSLLNQYGQVIGVTNAKLAADGYEGIGFAIPINEVKPIVEELIAKGYVSGRPVVGVSVSALSSMASSFYGFPRGLYVSSIAPDSNAYKTGLRPGDIITEFNGQPVASVTEAVVLRDACQVDQEIKLTIYRNRVYYEATIILEEQGLLGGDYNF